MLLWIELCLPAHFFPPAFFPVGVHAPTTFFGHVTAIQLEKWTQHVLWSAEVLHTEIKPESLLASLAVREQVIGEVSVAANPVSTWRVQTGGSGTVLAPLLQ